ncbi:hypothetical protein A3D84_05630 [Candidatus Woesebacteria bacterium RIFCSPHIGHO2_02_FULL_42_20]|uniref:Glycosyl transferase family 1 domain-containing protein n=1 Tax=Candidatus Woesebacteria bacterium RIFCSPHIGHO2_12_FULL_41_24 TaxID=1802510 RepID=A0A1F8ATQ2_9BACT|nr:MAG: hypothetical protein A2W15_01190 [Candidatus Woesebacteria bacterium RBG_16_41_13]OGM30389.1 MAG: hypothetical protein A2873_00315 [Candidatus Woesebacteria bacterium RIFCSPHIGHO2_01_FULL_42_80]OGM35435.1 MAG: hypothetical protein A3D84_05630 [Candidatus Woesebacteria bacterium RIFCSPHIGHO2_02_FULL_42_20]OGM55010.1 MAG: hypothetical protein A3E44_04615 [Candidatus Woesebacteria bacterium RIFCSPHIGHO2_12_FULL_41_24]OGM66356.1 MAG: hypothetical protein A2969_00235 [Candidatus Woesebacteri
MRVALVHDYLKEYGGAEGVLGTLHEMFPQAPIYTTVYLPEYLGPNRGKFNDADIRPSKLQFLPFKQKLIGPITMISPLIFKLMNFDGYDVVITSATGAYFPNFVNKGRAKLICYCHTPPRYIYGYKTARNWNRGILKVIGSLFIVLGRKLDFLASKNVDYYIANSKEVAYRIKRFYGRDSQVIYPPVDVRTYNKEHTTKKGNYYLTGGRLARNKRFDLAVAACTKLNLPLKVFGKSFAGYKKELKSFAGPTVEFLGEIAEEKKRESMGQAKAYISCSESEDFGITPVEVMASGTPVIAYKSGGVKETVVDKKTGVFFNELSVKSLTRAIKQFDTLEIKSSDCVTQAQKFSKERFEKEIKDFISTKI